MNGIQKATPTTLGTGSGTVCLRSSPARHAQFVTQTQSLAAPKKLVCNCNCGGGAAGASCSCRARLDAMFRGRSRNRAHMADNVLCVYAFFSSLNSFFFLVCWGNLHFVPARPATPRGWCQLIYSWLNAVDKTIFGYGQECCLSGHMYSRAQSIYLPCITWILDAGCWKLYSGLWVLGSVFWALGWAQLCSALSAHIKES